MSAGSGYWRLATGNAAAATSGFISGQQRLAELIHRQPQAAWGAISGVISERLGLYFESWALIPL